MTYRLQTSIDAGRIETDGEMYRIRDNAVEVDDKEVAEALLARYGHLYRMTEVGSAEPDSTPEPADSDADTETDDDVDADADSAEICGVEMASGEICQRPAGDCGYHGG